MPKVTDARRPRISTAKKVVFGLIPLLALFVLLEVGQRVLDWNANRKRLARGTGWELQTHDGVRATDKQGGIVLQHHPYVLYRMKPDLCRGAVTVNHVGYRVPEWPTSSEPKAGRRVFVLGGSTAFGLDCADQEGFAFLLDQRLRAAQTRVFNAGMIGYHSSQELVLLAQDICRLQPDVVVVFDGYNDFTYNAMMGPDAAELVPPMFEQIDVLLGRNSERLANVLRASAFLRRLERSLFPLRSDLGVAAYHDNRGIGVPLYRHNLTAMVRLAKAFGAAVILAPQPELFARQGELAPEERAVRDKAQHDNPGYSAIAATYAAYVAAARAVADAEGAAFVDVQAAFDAAPGVLFGDTCHLTPAGNEVVAGALLPALRELLR